MQYRLTRVFTLALMLLLLAAGCAPLQRPLPPQPSPQEEPDFTPERTAADNNWRSAVIADEVEDIDWVEDAVVIAVNRTVYVGVVLDDEKEGRITGDMRNQVVERVRSVDMRANRVYVTANANAVNTLRGYAGDIERGRPVSEFLDDLQRLFGRPDVQGGNPARFRLKGHL